MTANKATTEEIDNFLQYHTDWTTVDGTLQRTFTFRNFREAFGFMTEVALVAECSNHHPEWGNVYNRITVQLTTHDAGGITEKDFDLAQQMDSIASRR
jgi:4a-hydroxytetrahydrobiopterin dehydratase